MFCLLTFTAVAAERRCPLAAETGQKDQSLYNLDILHNLTFNFFDLLSRHNSIYVLALLQELAWSETI